MTVFSRSPARRGLPTVLAACAFAISAMLVSVAPAHAVGPGWAISATPAPTTFAPESTNDQISANAVVGEASATDGSTVTFSDTLPEGATATEITSNGEGFHCVLATLSCSSTAVLSRGELINFVIVADMGPHTAGSATNIARIVGGGLTAASQRLPVTIDRTPAGFGLESVDLTLANSDGTPDIQAGSHPYAMTTTVNFNQRLNAKHERESVDLAKDVNFNLPAGVVGNPEPLPQCTEPELFTNIGPRAGCPDDTVVGEGLVTASFPSVGGATFTYSVPIFNMVPPPGKPARFAFDIQGARVVIDTTVRTGRDYGITATVDNITQEVSFSGSQLTFWGVPAESSHDPFRGKCLAISGASLGNCSAGSGTPIAFLTTPTSCSGPLQSVVTSDSWAHPGALSEPSGVLTGESVVQASALTHDTEGNLLGLSGCNRVPFAPELEVEPNGTAGSTPTGLNIDVKVPQEVDLNPTGISESYVKSTTVTLPAGMDVSPSGGNGLAACSTAQIGFEGVDPSSGSDRFSAAPEECPEASKIGLVKIISPVLKDPIAGALYLAAPQNFAGLPENPFQSLIALYIVAEDNNAGVLVKLAGRGTLNPTTGQLATTFENTPQTPFSSISFELFGTDRAPLSTPAPCGAYTTTSSIEPWSGNAPATPPSTFHITSGPSGSACADPLPFAPGFNAETTNIQAGAFTPFSLTMSRPDGNQALAGVSMHMPPGLLGMISSVKLCPEPQASQGTCGPESMIGETIVSAGLGPDPYTVTGGKVYITTGYKGAPYGLSIVNPAKAGPFVLDEGRPVIVRAAINVDPRTAQLTVTSDPLPTILDGIPLQIQHVNVTINRSGFTFNPTDCNPLGITGTLTSQEGATAGVSSPFQITNCATLAYKPSLSVATGARTSRANGASLSFKIAYPKGAQGKQSWFKEARFVLPKQLPARLTTIQKACLAATFENDRGACPPASRIGTASVSTPVLANPLRGSVYFVSYGGAKFPDAVIALEGEGIKIDLHGETFINGKTGITSATFRDLPDVPFNSIEVTLPTGRYSEFAANLPAKAHGSFCGQKLVMPTKLAAQNGLEIHQNTPITITGCTKAKKAKHARRRSRH